MEDKKRWTDDIKELLLKDDRSYVTDCFYERIHRGLEVVTITYKSGAESLINVTGNSRGSILKEITKEVYGLGAFGKIKERWW